MEWECTSAYCGSDSQRLAVGSECDLGRPARLWRLESHTDSEGLTGKSKRKKRAPETGPLPALHRSWLWGLNLSLHPLSFAIPSQPCLSSPSPFSLLFLFIVLQWDHVPVQIDTLQLARPQVSHIHHKFACCGKKSSKHGRLHIPSALGFL